MKKYKTIMVLTLTHVEINECHFKDTMCLEAYESLEDALNSLEEEYNSIINERLFRGEKLISADIDFESDYYYTEIIYDNNFGVRTKEVLELHAMDLMLK